MTSPPSRRTFGRYEVLRPLGRGAVGEVYLARDPALGREVAVKTLAGLDALPPGERDEARARFLREARAAAALSHPHVVTIHDVGESDGVPFLAMELLRGTTLDRYTRAPHLLPPRKVLEIGVQAAQALDAAHRAGIVHRDVKPANLVLLEDGSAKVADFGLAKGARAEEGALTARDTLLGTPNYMAPEQIAGQPLDGRSDLFSLAVALFELLAGQRPFGGDTISSVLYRIVNDPPVDLRQACPDLPPQLAALFERALAKDPARRPATGAAFAAELAAELQRLGGSYSGPLPAAAAPRAADAAPTGAPPPRPAGARSTARPVALAAAFFGLAVVAAGVWMATRPRSSVVDLQTDPPGLALAVRAGAATLQGSTLTIAPGVATVTLAAADACREGTLTLAPPYPRRATVPAAPRTETVPVATEPAGAVVIVDGARVPGVTPVEVALGTCGAHRVEIGAEGTPPRTIELAPGEGVAAWRAKLASVALAPAGAARPDEAVPPAADGRVLVAAPAGYAAEVLDARGRRIGSAGQPLRLAAGRHRLTLAAPAVLVRVPLEVDVPAGGTARPAVAWPALGAITVRSVPSDLPLTIRARSGGPPFSAETPLNEHALGAGEYEITVDNAGRTATRNVAVGAGETAVVRFTQEDWP